MAALSRTDLERSLRQGLQPLYLLVGPERYLRRAAAHEIAEAALSTTLIREFLARVDAFSGVSSSSAREVRSR